MVTKAIKVQLVQLDLMDSKGQQDSKEPLVDKVTMVSKEPLVLMVIKVTKAQLVQLVR